MFGRSDECQAVLREYGLEGSSMAVIGADKPADTAEWRVMVTGGLKPEHLDADVPQRLSNDLAGIGQRALAERLSAAVETIKRQRKLVR
jgi:hypothetical protein